MEGRPADDVGGRDRLDRPLESRDVMAQYPPPKADAGLVRSPQVVLDMQRRSASIAPCDRAARLCSRRSAHVALIPGG